MANKVYRKIVEIEKSPFNSRYMLVLECGHTKWVSRRPRRDVTHCEQCAAQQALAVDQPSAGR